jgi:hypothetical protein
MASHLSFRGALYLFKETQIITFLHFHFAKLEKRLCVLPIGSTKKYKLKALQGYPLCLRQGNIRGNNYIPLRRRNASVTQWCTDLYPFISSRFVGLKLSELECKSTENCLFLTGDLNLAYHRQFILLSLQCSETCP